nr:hypothetical protein CFP56_52745 [Quercus suber]
MPDHDEESTTPFMADSSPDEKAGGPVATAWQNAMQSPTLATSLRRLHDGLRIASTHALYHSQNGLRAADAFLQRRVPALRVSQRRRNAVGLSALLIILLPFFIVLWKHAHPYHPPPPPPPPPRLYCSTWGSATPIPDNLWDRLYSEYRHWTQYGKDGIFKLIPEQQPLSVEGSRVPLYNKKKPAPQVPKANTTEPSSAKLDDPIRSISWIVICRRTWYTMSVILRVHCDGHSLISGQGGYLDAVHFIEHTTNMDDLTYLHNLVKVTPGYEALEVAPHCREDPHRHDCRYERIWEHFATDDDTIYIKMDDDIVRTALNPYQKRKDTNF